MGDHRGVAPMSMSGNLAENWEMWRSRLQNYFLASEINKKDEKVQCAQLLHYIGEEGYRIYKTFEFVEEDKDKLEKLIGKFDKYFKPKSNLSFERYKFFMCRQKPEQSLEQFITELKEQALKCKLLTLQDSLIKCMITCGVRNEEVRSKLLEKDEETTLQQAVDLCLLLENTRVQSSQMREGTSSSTSKEAEEVNALNRGKGIPAGQKYKQGHSSNKPSKQKQIVGCTRCGNTHAVRKCPAYGKVCNLCNYRNHFSTVCKNKVNSIVDSAQGESADSYLC